MTAIVEWLELHAKNLENFAETIENVALDFVPSVEKQAIMDFQKEVFLLVDKAKTLIDEVEANPPTVSSAVEGISAVATTLAPTLIQDAAQAASDAVTGFLSSKNTSGTTTVKTPTILEDVEQDLGFRPKNVTVETGTISSGTQGVHPSMVGSGTDIPKDPTKN